MILENKNKENLLRALRKSAPVVSAIIISYNTKAMTLDCIRTLKGDLGDLSAEIFVVDNASKDGSVEAVRETFPDVQVIANTQNAGFGEANNQAMRLAKGEFLLLLNSDAFPKPGAIATLVEMLRTQPALGLVGPRLLNGDETLQPSWNQFPSARLGWENHLYLSVLRNKLGLGLPDVAEPTAKTPGETVVILEDQFLSGACLLVRRSAYEQVGGFDPRFFFYYEEADWEKRLQEAGWPIAYTSRAEVTHLRGTSGGGNRLQFTVSAYTGRDYFVWKHHGLWGLLGYRTAVSAGFLIGLLRFGPPALLPNKESVARFALAVNARVFARQCTEWYRGARREGSRQNA